jgi:hypothetical protein
VQSWAQKQLSARKATGGVCFPAVCKGGLLKVCYVDGKDRGLFAASTFLPNDVITYVLGDRKPVSERTPGLDYLQVFMNLS